LGVFQEKNGAHQPKKFRTNHSECCQESDRHQQLFTEQFSVIFLKISLSYEHEQNKKEQNDKANGNHQSCFYTALYAVISFLVAMHWGKLNLF
jgi:hypothetical protein